MGKGQKARHVCSFRLENMGSISESNSPVLLPVRKLKPKVRETEATTESELEVLHHSWEGTKVYFNESQKASCFSEMKRYISTSPLLIEQYMEFLYCCLFCCCSVFTLWAFVFVLGTYLIIATKHQEKII